VRWMSFGWLRRWLPLLLPAAEFSWLAPWLLFLSGAFYPEGGHILAPFPAAGLLLGGYLLASAPPGERPLRRVRLGVLALAVALGLWAVWITHYRALPFWHPAWIWRLLRAAHDAIPAVPAPVLGAFAAPLVLWRGLVLGGREFSHFTAEQTFRRGVVWSVLFVFLFALYRDSRVFALARSVAAGYILTFFFLSLLLLALARLLGIWEEVQGKDPRSLAFNRPWFLVAVGAAAFIVLTGAALGGLAGAEVWPYLAPIFRLLAPVLEAIFLVLFFFASLIARLILYLLSRIPRRWVPPRPVMNDPIGDVLRAVRDLEVSPQVVYGARWGMVLFVVLLLSLAIVLAVVRRRRRAAAVDGDDRESVWSRDSLLKGLRRLFVRRRLLRELTEDLTGTPEALAVRMLYRRLLRAAAEVGQSRRRDQTPREFAQVVEPFAGNAADDLRALTGVYETVRYGAHRPSRDEVAAAQGWLERLRAVFPPRTARSE